jgi:hypothetical protein
MEEKFTQILEGRNILENKLQKDDIKRNLDYSEWEGAD